jgi:hypothetical protein
MLEAAGWLAAAVAAGSAVWWLYGEWQRRSRHRASDPGGVRAKAELADRVLESMPEARFEDRDLHHRHAAKYD